MIRRSIAGVSRSSKTPTSIYLANRGYKVANIPIVVESPPPSLLFGLKHPLVVGLLASPERIVQIRQNRLLGLNAHRDDDQLLHGAAVGAYGLSMRGGEPARHRGDVDLEHRGDLLDLLGSCGNGGSSSPRTRDRQTCKQKNTGRQQTQDRKSVV